MNWLTHHTAPVRLHSGQRSHWLIDAQAIFENEHLRRLVLDCWFPFVQNWPNPYIVGIRRGGVPWARALAERIGAPWSDDTSVPKRSWHGFDSILVVDDVLTTGASLREVQADAAFVVVDRSHGEAVPYAVSWMTLWLPTLEDEEEDVS